MNDMMHTPPGNPRKRNQRYQAGRDVNAATRVLAALDLALAGHDWQSIANQTGYGSRGAAFHAVQRELERRIEPRVDQLRRMQWERLQAYRRVYVPKALAGDGYSFDRCLRIDEREATLMGLDAKDLAASDAAMPTIVREVYPAQWVDALNALAAGGGPAPLPPELDPPDYQP